MTIDAAVAGRWVPARRQLSRVVAFNDYWSQALVARFEHTGY